VEQLGTPDPLTLARLPRTQVGEMIEKVTDGKPLPAEILHQIVSKTDGVLLFVEELTKMVLESGLVREEEGRYVGAYDGAFIPPLAIPATLQDSLMARLDRLAPVREIAQVGAMLGREFSYELLHAVSPLDEATLQQGLTQLVEAELVYQRGLVPQAHYRFKHALIQDAAYQSLLKSTRQQYHRQIAQVLVDRFPETVEALAVVNKTGERVEEAELYRLKGELSLQSGVHSPQSEILNTQHLTPTTQIEAEACFQKAIAVARQQSAKSLELRAVMSLSRLWQRQGKKDEARQLLVEIYDWFTEGFDTKDLQEARALLDKLT
jgi:predicted ATPase